MDNTTAETTDAWIRWAISGGIFFLCLGLAFASKFILTSVVGVFAKRTKTQIDDLIIEALKTPIFLGLILLGVWLALLQVPEFNDYDSAINKALTVVLIFLMAMAVSRIVDALLTWYGAEIAHRTHSDIDEKLIPILRRVEKVVIYSIALMLSISSLGQDISPLIAGLGIGGLAVALALQPTLSSFLAGTYITTDAVIRSGHYIQMDNGTEGFVETIGWRITQIRDWQGNLVIIPNSKLADAIVTDYDVPQASILFKVDCGVSYDSDLDQVERVALEIASDIMRKYPEGSKTFEPVVRFKEFGDSNINFSVVLEAKDRMSHFPLKSEFIKALHSRFNEEGIKIQYPVRKLLFDENHPADREIIASSARMKALSARVSEEEASKGLSG